MVAARSAVALVVGLYGAAEGVRVRKRSSVTCGAKGLTSQIVNGQNADECEWNWQVSLWKGSRGPYCGGTLIAPDWILTAAHCTQSGTDFQIRAGDYNSKKASANVQTIQVKRVVNHPSYNSRNMTHDFSLVQVEKPFDMSQCVGTACLPTEELAAGSKCWITGWGTLSSGGSQPDVLQEVSVDILSNTACKQTGYSSSDIDDSMICAQGRTEDGKITDACQGDSGGPLVCETNGAWAVHGATSWGYGCAGASHPGIWARVHYQIDWIEAIINGEEPETPEPPAKECPSYCMLCLTNACIGCCN